MDSIQAHSHIPPAAQSKTMPQWPQPAQNQLPSLHTLLNLDNPKSNDYPGSSDAERPSTAAYSPTYSPGSGPRQHQNYRYSPSNPQDQYPHQYHYAYGQPRLDPTPFRAPLHHGYSQTHGHRASYGSVDTSSTPSYSEASTRQRPSISTSEATRGSYGLSPGLTELDAAPRSPHARQSSGDQAGEGRFGWPAAGQGRFNSEPGWQTRSHPPPPLNFGVTKAGKPRKRLAEACCFCREKKIRCKPGPGDKCQTCADRNLDCAKPTDMLQSVEANNMRKRRIPSDDASSLHHSGNRQTSADPPDADSRPTSKDAINGTPNGSESKRLRLSPKQQSDRAVSEQSDRSTTKSQSVMPIISTPRGELSDPTDRALHFEWKQDPYETHQHETLNLLELVFRHRQCGPSVALPELAFKEWVRTCRDKSDNDRMVLYAVLAIGSLYATSSDFKDAGKRFMAIARYAANAKFGAFTLQLAQTRVFLSLYMFAVGQAAESYEWIGLGLRVLSALKYNLESGVNAFQGGPKRSEFGLSETQTVECRRRTFWAAYLLGRQTGYSTGNASALHDDDIFLRLPVTDEQFQDGVPNQVPFLDNANMDEDDIVTAKTTGLGFLALQVMIISIWGQCTGHGYRAAHISTQAYPQVYTTFYENLHKRLAIWEAVLPPHLKYSASNTERALKAEQIEPYFILHSIGFVVHMKANRVASHALLPAETITRNLREARRAADALLALARVLDNAVADQRDTPDLARALAQPFPAYCLMCACDIASRWGAAAAQDETHRRLTAALALASRMARYWCTANIRMNMIVARARQLSAAQLASQDQPPHFRQLKPIEPSVFTPDNADDLVYQTPDSVYLEAFAGSGSGR